MTLYTKSLKFKKILDDDAEKIYQIFSNKELTGFFVSGQDKSKKDAEKRMNSIIAHWNEYGFGDFILLDKATEMLVGYGGLHHKVKGGNINISYIILQEYQGKGLGYETSMGLLDYGFNTLDLQTIAAEIDPNNLISQKLIEKCGFKFNRIIEWKGFERKEYIINKSDYRQAFSVKD